MNPKLLIQRFRNEYRKHKKLGLWVVLRVSWIKYKHDLKPIKYSEIKIKGVFK